MNKQELITKIKQLDGLSHDERAYLVELVNTKKKYGLVWEDKPETVEEQLRTQLPVLKEVTERRILAKDLPQPEKQPVINQPTLFDNNNDNLDNKDNNDNPLPPPNHILIEGDNLHALTALTFTHEGQIDVMYFDPPYNTGNKDFKYNDSFVDREDSYRHSKWLSFMDKRLRIAKRLLSEKGIIYISINDIEQAQLKLTCDSIFGEENFIVTFIWHSRQNVDSRSLNGASSDHEYVHCYSKHPDSRIRGKVINTAKYSNIDNDPRGPWMSSPIDGLATAKNRPNLHYTITNEQTGLQYNPSPSTGWRFQRSTLEQLITENRIIWPKNPSSKPRMKRYLNELKNEYTGFSSILDVDFTTDGTNELRSIMGNETLKFPKPVNLIYTLIEQGLSKNDLVLDIFAGSGTTLHATMQLNAEDGGNRQCILVTNNENNIAEEVCYERNRRVIQGYTNSKGDLVPGLTNNNLRYYKSEFVESAKNEENRRKLTLLSTELLQIKEDCYQPGELPKTVKPNQAQAFTNDKGKFMLVVYYHRQQRETSAVLTQWIKSLPGVQGKIKLYGFSPETEVLVNDFFEVADKINPIPLPDAIYNAYRNTFRTLGINKRAKSRSNPSVDNSTEDNENAENEEPVQTDLFS